MYASGGGWLAAGFSRHWRTSVVGSIFNLLFMIVEYSPKGKKISDFEALSFAKEAFKKGKNISVANEIVFLAFRVLVKKGEIPPYDGVVFIFEGKKIHIDRNGECDTYPLGWCETATSFLFMLMCPTGAWTMCDV